MEIIMSIVVGFLFMAAIYLILSKSLLRIIIGTGLLLKLSIMFWNKNKKKKYQVLPDKGVSYVMTENGEPMPTYYRPNSGLFCSTPLSENDTVYFLNIRRPVVMDVENVAPIVIPDDLPAECDGIPNRTH